MPTIFAVYFEKNLAKSPPIGVSSGACVGCRKTDDTAAGCADGESASSAGSAASASAGRMSAGDCWRLGGRRGNDGHANEGDGGEKVFHGPDQVRLQVRRMSRHVGRTRAETRAPTAINRRKPRSDGQERSRGEPQF